MSAMGQPTGPTQPSIPSGSVNEYNPCDYIDNGSGDHKTADLGGVWLVLLISVCGRQSCRTRDLDSTRLESDFFENLDLDLDSKVKDLDLDLDLKGEDLELGL